MELSSGTKSLSQCTPVRHIHTLPFDSHSHIPDATLMLVGSQVTFITRFFLSRNIRIARDRVWAQTVASRGYGADFWGPYVEEWDAPPVVEDSFERRFTQKWLGGWIGRFVVKRGAYDVGLLCVAGICTELSSWL